jgi:hypothetical protein
LGTKKNFEAFEVAGCGEKEAIESDTVTVLEEGANRDNFRLKFEGIEKLKFELVLELAPEL